MKKTIVFLVMSFMIAGSVSLVNATATKSANEADTEGKAKDETKGGYTDKKINEKLVVAIAVEAIKANPDKRYIGPENIKAAVVDSAESFVLGKELPEDVIVIVTPKKLNANENEESEAAFLTGFKFEGKPLRVIVIQEDIQSDLGNARAQTKVIHELLHVAQPAEIKGPAKELLAGENKLGHNDIRAIEQTWITKNAETAKIGDKEIKLDKPVIVIRPSTLDEASKLEAAIEKTGLAGQIKVELDKAKIDKNAVVIGAGVADMANTNKVEVTAGTFNTDNISAFVIGLTSAYEFTRASMMYKDNPSDELGKVLLAHAQALVTDKSAIPGSVAKLVEDLLSGKLAITLIPAAAEITVEWMNAHQEASRTWMGL